MAERARKSTNPAVVEGAEIVAKLDSVLTECGVYTSASSDPGRYRITVDMTYRTARRLTEVLQGASDG